ncbi:MaoC family dehydratase N-terminal domain-containing protein [Streptomyces sp. NPDC055078]
MPLDRTLIGSRSRDVVTEVERGRLRFFARATGQSAPEYVDVEAARAAGHRDLPVPPTFLFCLNMDVPDPFGFLDELGVDPLAILHGEQSFEYHAQAYAGDTLTFSTVISDMYDRKGGVLEFLVRSTDVTRDGELIGRMTSTLVIPDRSGNTGRSGSTGRTGRSDSTGSTGSTGKEASA